mmetsp:Transcript_29404/g.94399  ORF Transcript_29404/g.94399 Transcript_29404/m.94399 type:complete len:649 (-) Transcript_29404:820-2766(-)|eukprot:CAMPEP_0118856862 /NCGR_PEP_ID=MMETSP1163-20130328/4177_1 /TAXON_ID=124430 /ORGANISM="Phaeomonas parva, Strain CCMP2877" /LENGTH=648 /DNA_ID=CAMNT_0006790053 /DNA_START=71 /DNA_END=2017 /DNA_ORIENTATION=+
MVQSTDSSTKGIPFLREVSQTENRIIFLATLCMLSADHLNPIKIVTELLHLPAWPVTYVCGALLLNVVYVNLPIIAYAMIRTFFHSILSIFFRDIQLVGVKNIPENGPIIFTGNHGNQFVDALMVMCNCRHKVGFMIAEKSMHRPVIGDFAKAIGCIPVVRAQDTAKRATGLIRIKDNKVEGKGTSFTTTLSVKYKLRLAGAAEEVRVLEVIDDTTVLLDKAPTEQSQLDKFSPFDVIAYVDQKNSFRKVWEAFDEGSCLGIFPEGGSHDRSDLLPLKAGVSLISFGALEEFNIEVPVVPVGLNYSRRHRFRGSAVIEFGAPIHITPELQELYASGKKREATTAYLDMIDDGMRSVIVTAPDGDRMKLIHTARRIWVQDAANMGASQKQDLSRRFAEGCKLLEVNEDEKIRKGLADVEKRLQAYQDRLDQFGLKDYQVPVLQRRRTWRMVYKLTHMTSVMVLSSVPTLLLNAPVGLLARYVAEKERVKALAKSRVKLEAKDVMLSKKIQISIVAVPVLWITYAVILKLIGVPLGLVILTFLSFPVFSYIGVLSAEAGMVDYKDLRPFLMQLLPDPEGVLESLPEERAALRRDLRKFVNDVGPLLGPLFTEKHIDWVSFNQQRKVLVGVGVGVGEGAGMAGKSKSKKNV